MALVHSRFSTNTFPSWPLAHPYRYVAHNGEINTVQGNRNWMRTREALLASDLLPGLERAFPICTPGGSDSATFDEVLELLHLAGRSLPHAMMMMIPEAWENNLAMPVAKRAFYRFHASLMEPWDGPACVAFTDGTVIGAVLDRNGLRPSRYWETADGVVVMASEAGVIDVDPASVVRKGRLQPGRMFLIDTAAGRIVEDDELKQSLAGEHPYGAWLDAGIVKLADLPEREHVVFSHSSVLRRQQVFGYTHEEMKILIAPMAQSGAEPIGSMGTDTPIAVLSKRPAVAVRLLPTAVRAGHQPAARRDPRGGRDVGRQHDRAGGQPAASGGGELSPARAAVPRDRQRRARQDHPHQRRFGDGDGSARFRRCSRGRAEGGRRSVPATGRRHRERSLPGGRRWFGIEPGARRDPLRGQCGDRGRGADHRAQRPQQRRRVRPDPQPAVDGGGAPSPDP